MVPFPKMCGNPEGLGTDGADVGPDIRVDQPQVRAEADHLLAAQLALGPHPIVHRRHVQPLVGRRHKRNRTTREVAEQPPLPVDLEHVSGEVSDLGAAEHAGALHLLVRVGLVGAQLAREKEHLGAEIAALVGPLGMGLGGVAGQVSHPPPAGLALDQAGRLQPVL